MEQEYISAIQAAILLNKQHIPYVRKILSKAGVQSVRKGTANFYIRDSFDSVFPQFVGMIPDPKEFKKENLREKIRNPKFRNKDRNFISLPEVRNNEHVIYKSVMQIQSLIKEEDFSTIRQIVDKLEKYTESLKAVQTIESEIYDLIPS